MKVRLIFCTRGGKNWANSCDSVSKDKPKSVAMVGEIVVNSTPKDRKKISKILPKGHGGGEK